MSAFSAGPTALTRKIGSPYLPGDDDAEQADGLSDAFSAIPGPPARSRTGGATAVSPGAGANPTSAFSPDPSTTYSTPGSGASQPNLIRDVYAPELQDVSQKLQDAYAAPRPGLFRQIVGALLSKRNPTIGGVVSDWLLHRTGSRRIARSLLIAVCMILALASLVPAMPPPYQQDAPAKLLLRVAPHHATVPPKQ